jgi:hypothetical protein
MEGRSLTVAVAALSGNSASETDVDDDGMVTLSRRTALSRRSLGVSIDFDTENRDASEKNPA